MTILLVLKYSEYWCWFAILLCIYGGAHVSEGFIRHSLALPSRHILHFPTASGSVSAIISLRMTVEFMPLDSEKWTLLNTSTFVKFMEPTIPHSEDTENDSQSYIYSPQIVSSVQSARTLLDEWMREDPNSMWSTEWKSVTYFDDDCNNLAGQIALHGYLVRNAQFHAHGGLAAQMKVGGPSTYILLFPTAVGAQDLFLFYKASQIVNHPALQHCMVMIVDLFSDQTGWLWDKMKHSDQYIGRRDDLLRHSISKDERRHVGDKTETREVSHRRVLQCRIDAAFNYLNSYNSNENFMAAALGWCFGGHCIAELARMPNCDNVRAMITFHGVFSGLQLLSTPDDNDHIKPDDDIDFPRRRKSEVLICHGLQDPFVPSDDLEKALILLQQYGHTTSLLQLDAKHGFTNPAQIHNSNPAFGYHPESAHKAWHQALALLTRRVGRTPQL